MSEKLSCATKPVLATLGDNRCSRSLVAPEVPPTARCVIYSPPPRGEEGDFSFQFWSNNGRLGWIRLHHVLIRDIDIDIYIFIYYPKVCHIASELLQLHA